MVDYISVLHELANKANAVKKELLQPLNLPPNIGTALIKPHLNRACKELTPKAVSIVMNKYKSSGLQKRDGDLEAVLKKVYLEIRWTKNKATVALALPAGLGEQTYAKVNALDKGRLSSKGKTKAWNCFSLTMAEKQALGNQITNLAMKYMQESQGV